MSQDSKPNRGQRSNKWLALINIPVQMGVIIFLFAYGGKWLDAKFDKDYFVKILVVVGVLIAFYNLNRQLKSINESED